MYAVKVPYDQLSPEALEGLIEDFVTRDGTDYGEVEVSLEHKVSQVLSQLRSGTSAIVYDLKSETCTILKSDDSVLKALED